MVPQFRIHKTLHKISISACGMTYFWEKYVNNSFNKVFLLLKKAQELSHPAMFQQSIQR